MTNSPLDWLLEADQANPGVRLLALRDLLGRPDDDPQIVSAQSAVMRSGPVPIILDAQYPAGYWVKPGPGYSPKYRSTLWQIIFLAQLGADGRDERIRRAVEHVCTHAQTEAGAFSCNGRRDGIVPCLWGNLVRSLFDLGYGSDERVARAVDGLARSITGDGYDAYAGSPLQGPGFVCAINDGLPCAWGAIRALRALNRVPTDRRSAVVLAAIAACTAFLLGHDIARAAYPPVERISPHWFEFGYPLGYTADVLLNLEALVEAGCGSDPRLDEARALVRSRQDARGRWRMELSYNGRMWANVEKRGKPSKWVTLRALRVSV